MTTAITFALQNADSHARTHARSSAHAMLRVVVLVLVSYKRSLLTKSTTAASKGNRFNKQNTNSALASLFLVYFFTLLYYDVIFSIATFYVGRAHVPKNTGGLITNVWAGGWS